MRWSASSCTSPSTPSHVWTSLIGHAAASAGRNAASTASSRWRAAGATAARATASGRRGKSHGRGKLWGRSLVGASPWGGAGPGWWRSLSISFLRCPQVLGQQTHLCGRLRALRLYPRAHRLPSEHPGPAPTSGPCPSRSPLPLLSPSSHPTPSSSSQGGTHDHASLPPPLASSFQVSSVLTSRLRGVLWVGTGLGAPG